MAIFIVLAWNWVYVDSILLKFLWKKIFPKSFFFASEVVQIVKNSYFEQKTRKRDITLKMAKKLEENMFYQSKTLLSDIIN